jgi:transposase-like protein
VMSDPLASVHFPGSTGEFLSWFSSDVDCMDYLAWLRWPDGFVCPMCSHLGGWRLGDGRFMCSDCGARTSVTAGTIFDRTRTPMTVWFHACWMFATQKDGVSAVSLQRVLEIGSYQTAWAMLHRLRSVLVRPGRDRLTGTVEMDETYVGGDEPGLRGGRAKGKKVLVGIAVERRQPTGFGRARLAVLPDVKIETLRGFLHDHIAPGSTVATDGLQVYKGIMSGYTHERTIASDTSLPGVHRVASLLKRWLLSTHQGSVDDAHLPGYLNEFAFRFNRRTSRNRGLLFLRALELAVAHDPVRYKDLVLNPEQRPRSRPPVPPPQRGHPTSVQRPVADRPWRQPA